jgi:hypothetical protein
MMTKGSGGSVSVCVCVGGGGVFSCDHNLQVPWKFLIDFKIKNKTL